MNQAQMLKEGAKQLGLELATEQIELFDLYLTELKKWNKRISLTSIVTDNQIVSRHFLDSLSCIASRRIKPFSRVADIGAGAGLPGIPLKIAQPSLTLTLVDSSQKKVRFLESLIKELGLDKTEVVCQRAEEFGKVSSNRESYDIVVARAIAVLPVLLEYGMPLLKLGGLLIAQKGKLDPEELKQSDKAARTLGGRIEPALAVNVPFLAGERHLIIVEKQEATPLKYPRRTGIPRKRPLSRG